MDREFPSRFRRMGDPRDNDDDLGIPPIQIIIAAVMPYCNIFQNTSESPISKEITGIEFYAEYPLFR